jgi:hypothetical protein
MSSPSNISDNGMEEIKLPKNCKENRYYHKHRQVILEKKLKKRLEDPEYRAKFEEKQKKKAEKEEMEKIKAAKREERKKAAEERLEKAEVKKKMKLERISEILNSSASVPSGAK